MTYRRYALICAAIPLLLACALAPLPAAATDRDPFTVHTSDKEFVNWASTHEGVFAFPAPALYERVLLHCTIECPGAPGDCDPWDRFAKLSLRHWLNETEFEGYEIHRFITPYDITGSGGPGSCGWTSDLTDYQFLLHDDVTLLLYIDSWIGGDKGWLLTFDFEMTPGTPEREPFAIERLWHNGWVNYGDPDNPIEDHVQTVDTTMPAAATWAAFKGYLTGHGFWNTDNAAEFSNKAQRLFSGPNQEIRYLWRPDCDLNPCSPQLGTWQYDRAGWCPGDKADPWHVDISDWLIPGEINQLDFMFQPYLNYCRPNNPDCVDVGGCDCGGHAYYRFEGQVIYFRIPNVTAVDDGRPVPGLLHLAGNYPNPFNPQTTIRYHLAAAATVTVSVYDPEGKLVRSEDLRHEAEGTYAWTWNGRDRGGRLMPAGVYLYEISSGRESVSAKMLMLK